VTKDAWGRVAEKVPLPREGDVGSEVVAFLTRSSPKGSIGIRWGLVPQDTEMRVSLAGCRREATVNLDRLF
jgi:hypothetical protein